MPAYAGRPTSPTLPFCRAKSIQRAHSDLHLKRKLLSLLPDYYDLVLFGIHHFGIRSICYGKQMPVRQEMMTAYKMITLFFSFLSTFKPVASN